MTVKLAKAPEIGSGFIKYPDGTLIQFGNYGVYQGNDSVKVLYPISFKTVDTIQITPTYFNEPKAFVSIGDTSATGFEAFVYENTFGNEKARNFYWLAIGKWK